MFQRFGSVLLLGALALAYSEDGPVANYHNLSVGGLTEFGRIQGGRYGSTPRFKKDWVDHAGAFMTQTVDVNDRLTFDMGLGGLFEYQKSDIIQAEWGGTQYKNFFIGPTIADLNYKLIAQGDRSASIQFGLFPYKYNDDAANLGEYLFRTNPYPTTIMTGGYAFVNATSTYLQGLRGEYKSGNFSAELFLTTETTMPTLYDFSLAGIVKYKMFNGFVDLMGGVNAKRILPVKPSKTSVKTPSNAYFTKDGTTYVGFDSYYIEKAKYYKNQQDSATARGDAAAAAAFGVQSQSFQTTGDSVRSWIDTSKAVQPDYKYYTLAGTVVVGALSLDFKKLFDSEIFGANDLRLYSEIALLGITNYPVYYEKRSERMPIMVGFNFPGFKFLDLISIQYEYFNSPFMNSYLLVGQTNDAVPTIPEASDKDRSKNSYNDISDRDNKSWSVLIKKNLTKGVSISGQVARDHMRTVSIDSWFGPGLEPTEVLGTEKDWYWMFQLSFGI